MSFDDNYQEFKILFVYYANLFYDKTINLGLFFSVIFNKINNFFIQKKKTGIVFLVNK